MNKENYLNMQKNHYDNQAALWSLENRNPVVGSYDEHNRWKDYDEFLFKNFETKELRALEYGCGPGRNLIRFSNRFKQIDGTDIGKINIEKARLNLDKNNITNSEVFVCDGQSIPKKDSSYDVVFSVICLQHISCYDIRFSIFKDVHRVLKKGGKFCFQMGFGGRPAHFIFSSYYENVFNAESTNGHQDVSFDDENFMKDDLLVKLPFKNYMSDIRPIGPGDTHRNWIWIQVEK